MKSTFNFANGILKIDLREAALSYVTKHFVPKSSEIVHTVSDRCAKAPPDRIGEKDGVEQHCTVPFLSVAFFHGGQETSISSLVWWRLPIVKVYSILRLIFPFTFG